jgi:hypothetical protein
MEMRAKSLAKEDARRAVKTSGPDIHRRHDGTEASTAKALRQGANGASALSGEPGLSHQRTGVEALQRLAGNRAVCDLLSVGQAKLEVGAAGDRYEQEADTLARRVVTALRSAPESTEGSTGPTEGTTGPIEEAEEQVGRAVSIGAGPTLWDQIGRVAADAAGPEVGLAGGSLQPGTEAAINSARSGGTPLDAGVRGAMENAFGADFSQVKVHSGPAAADLNRRVQASAFTIGNDIFFRDGVPDARTGHGQELLAHELTHTIQQGGAETLPE